MNPGPPDAAAQARPPPRDGSGRSGPHRELQDRTP